MSCTTYTCWLNDGSPWSDCQPTRDFIAMLYRHGYTGPKVGIGDLAHQTANPPEDHTAFSHTPWPGPQPYPRILAIDIMPGFGIDVIALSGQLFDDKSSGVPGLAPLKYMNWTDTDNNCWHDSWQPNHTRYKSTDRGHLHISWRTDYVNSTLLATYDPFGTTPVPSPSPARSNDVGYFFSDANQSQFFADSNFEQYWAFRGGDGVWDTLYAVAGKPPTVNTTATQRSSGMFGKYAGIYQDSMPRSPQACPDCNCGGSADHTHSVASATTGPVEPV